MQMWQQMLYRSQSCWNRNNLAKAPSVRERSIIPKSNESRSNDKSTLVQSLPKEPSDILKVYRHYLAALKLLDIPETNRAFHDTAFVQFIQLCCSSHEIVSCVFDYVSVVPRGHEEEHPCPRSNDRKRYDLATKMAWLSAQQASKAAVVAWEENRAIYAAPVNRLFSQSPRSWKLIDDVR